MHFNLGKIKFYITWHFLALITFMLSLKAQNVLYAVVFSLFHEMGHLCAMVSVGNKPLAVSFEITGINIRRNESTGISLAKEVIIAFAGPFTNLIIFVFFVLIYSQNENSRVLSIASVNLILAVFNLLPIKGLDGGKILYYSLSEFFSFRTAKTVLIISSAIFIFLILFYGVYVLYITKYNFTMLIIALMLTLSMFSAEEC